MGELILIFHTEELIDIDWVINQEMEFWKQSPKKQKVETVNRLCLHMIWLEMVKGAFLVLLHYLACYNA